VYALGALVYHALSGVAPHAGDDTRDVVARRAHEAPVALEARVRDVPRDLATIVRKAMAARPEDRYPTARGFAEDLRRFQTGQLVSARSYSRWTLLGRWLRRHRAAVGTVAAAALTLGVVGSLSVRRVVRERNRAERALVESRARADALVLQHAQNALDRDPTAALAWIRAYPRGAADQAAAWNVVVEAEARGVARHALFAEESEPLSAAISPDGRVLALGNFRHLLLWDRSPSGGDSVRRDPAPVGPLRGRGCGLVGAPVTGRAACVLAERRARGGDGRRRHGAGVARAASFADAPGARGEGAPRGVLTGRALGGDRQRRLHGAALGRGFRAGARPRHPRGASLRRGVLARRPLRRVGG
jgi:hypothetical protein